MAGRTKTKAELERELDGCKAALAATIVQNDEVQTLLARVHRIQQDGLVMLALSFADVRDERNELRAQLRLAHWANKTLKVAITRPYEWTYEGEPRLPLALDLELPCDDRH